MIDIIRQTLVDCQKVLTDLVENKETIEQISSSANLITDSFKSGGKVFSCGNGGSMSDAMHFAEELTGRFRESRKPLPAIAISDPGHITCTANDFGFEYIFSRYIEAHGIAGDVLFAISTSGNSPNVVNAAKVAKDRDMKVIGLTGNYDTKLEKYCNHLICTPGVTQYADRIQELHIKVIHILIDLCEKKLFNQD